MGKVLLKYGVVEGWADTCDDSRSESAKESTIVDGAWAEEGVLADKGNPCEGPIIFCLGSRHIKTMSARGSGSMSTTHYTLTNAHKTLTLWLYLTFKLKLRRLRVL